jgi:hypothetical protein
MTALEIVEARVAAERMPFVKSKNDVVKIEVTTSRERIYVLVLTKKDDSLCVYRHHNGYTFNVALFYNADDINVKADLCTSATESNFSSVKTLKRDMDGCVRVARIEQVLLAYFNKFRNRNQVDGTIVKRVELILDRDDS